MMRFILPLVVFLALAALLFVSLSPDRDPRAVPFPGVGKAAPDFSLPQLNDPAKKFSPADMKGKVWLFNLWASWCTACREEHPLLMALSQQGIVPIVGLDYKDKQPEAEAWLARGGNPYMLNVTDVEGRIGINYGITGVPETFVIDKHGVIRYKLLSMLTPENLKQTILPLVKQLEQEP
jgi:cytochrome c biogenesis protein CcmG/thiol:disulfide interchange protein DsbE